ncbi:MAG: hypothetical protein DYH13_11360 [Alphaproteobacteria bacterium PRO2]|nr:hypothetical protein [Alphaproteobacteria bacterium PRO2]
MFTMGLTSFEQIAIWAVFAVAWLGLGYAIFLRSQILGEDKGTPKMQEVWGFCMALQRHSENWRRNGSRGRKGSSGSLR